LIPRKKERKKEKLPPKTPTETKCLETPSSGGR